MDEHDLIVVICELTEMLKQADCPFHCVDGQIRTQTKVDGYDSEPCKWCKKRADLVNLGENERF